MYSFLNRLSSFLFTNQTYTASVVLDAAGPPDPETLKLIESGELDPEEAEDFENLDDDLKEMVLDGDIDLDEALDL